MSIAIELPNLRIMADVSPVFLKYYPVSLQSASLE